MFPWHFWVDLLTSEKIYSLMSWKSSRAVSESSTPTSDPEPEVCETDYATRAKMILDITFSRVRHRLTEQQATIQRTVEIYAFMTAKVKWSLVNVVRNKRKNLGKLHWGRVGYSFQYNCQSLVKCCKYNFAACRVREIQFNPGGRKESPG